MAVQLPQSSSLPLLAPFPQAGSHKAARASGLAEASGCQKEEYPRLQDRDFNSSRGPPLAEAGTTGEGVLSLLLFFVCLVFGFVVCFSLAGVSLYGQAGLELLIILP